MPELVELKKTDLSPMVRAGNKGLFKMWINADLFKRSGFDVRRSVVFLDEDKLMVDKLPVAATTPQLWDTLMAKPEAEKQVVIDALYNAGARYWVRGLE